MKKVPAIFSLLALTLALPASAAPKADFTLPAQAVEVAPGLYKLGTSYDVESDAFIEGYAFVHKKGQARNANARSPKGTKCYAVMAAGAKWKSIEPWEVFVGGGLDATFLLNKLNQSIDTWEIAAVNPNILGTGSVVVGTATDPYILNNLNQVSFGDLDNGTIAVTVVWGIWGGPTFGREIVAWDQIYNTDYQWSDSGELNKIDFWNIAIHELGHSMGLSDIYNSSCSEVTMYGYGDYGETKKQTLELADITGINLLY